MSSDIPKRPLTNRQREFVKHYTSGHAAMTAAHAARLSGYSGRSSDSLAVTGSNLLKNAKVIQAIEAEERRTQLDTDISKADIISRLIAIADDDSKSSNTNAKVNALALVAKMQGMIVARQEIRGQIHHKVEPLTAYSVDDLRSMLGGATPREIDGTAPMTIDARVLKTEKTSLEEN
jgi:phage terminase small subunit